MPRRPETLQSDLFSEIGTTMGSVECWADSMGYSSVIGVDEAGRGPLAGPVVAAAVVLDLNRAKEDGWLPFVADSKQLSAQRREELFALIGASARFLAVEETNAEEIDRKNILVATLETMARCVRRVLAEGPPEPTIVIIDGNRPVPGLASQRTVVKGDQRSYNVAAASILAKVTRDRIMEAFATRWPQYGFEQHKGYPTAEHRRRILQYGECPIHRRTFRVRSPDED